jgi:hypothetical protein
MKRLLIIAMMAGLAVNLMAQWEVGGIDSLTIGSKAKYWSQPSIVPDGVTMNASRFNWYFTDNLDATITAGITVDETPSGGSYAEDSIHVSFAEGTYTAGTTIKVKTAEISQPVFGTGCTGSEEELEIFFVAKPAITLTTGSDGECSSTATDFDIPIDVNGYGPFVVTFDVTYNAGAPVTHTATIGSVSTKGANSLNLNVTVATHLDSGDGNYEIDVTDITDRFSRKSLVGIGGVVTSNTYTIGLSPAPTTNPIRHIRNL